jgi:hypothetical protein
MRQPRWLTARYLLLSASASLTIACAAQPARQQAASTPGSAGQGPYMLMEVGDDKRQIEVEKLFTEWDPQTGKSGAWLGYALARRIWLDSKFHERFPTESAYRLTFDEELDARDTAAAIWVELAQKEALTDRYFKDLGAVRSAGFMRDYVWHCVPHGAWTEPAGLRDAEFARWLTEHLPAHQVETWVTVIPHEKQKRVILGAAPHAPKPCAVVPRGIGRPSPPPTPAPG